MIRISFIGWRKQGQQKLGNFSLVGPIRSELDLKATCRLLWFWVDFKSTHYKSLPQYFEKLTFSTLTLVFFNLSWYHATKWLILLARHYRDVWLTLLGRFGAKQDVSCLKNDSPHPRTVHKYYVVLDRRGPVFSEFLKSFFKAEGNGPVSCSSTSM